MTDEKDTQLNQTYGIEDELDKTDSFMFDDDSDISNNYTSGNDEAVNDTQDNYSYEEYEESEEDDEEEDDDKKPKSNKTQMGILLGALVIIAAVGIVLLIKLVGNNQANKNSAPSSVPIIESATNKEENVATDDSFFNEADNEDMMSVDFNDEGSASVAQSGINPANPATVTDTNQNETSTKDNDILFDNIQEEKEKNSDIMVSWNGASRQNPFKPPVIQPKLADKYETFGDVQFEIIEPPSKSVPDENLTQLLKTQISGILYDSESPSAIVNLGGKDQFVKIGDNISGYRIKNITRNKVEISYKNNTYVASVGELFTPGKLESERAVANLTNKFGGRYKNVEE